MKIYYAVLFLATSTALLSCSTNKDVESLEDRTWTEAERTLLLEGLKRTRDEVLELVNPLSDEQWYFREDTSHWSIAEVLEHQQVHDQLYYREITVLIQFPEAGNLLLLRAQGSDEQVLSYGQVTTQNTGKSPWYLEPRGRWCSKRDAINAFLEGRNSLIKFVESTDKNLRMYVTPSGRGEAPMRDLHQLMLISIAHTDRHIVEIKGVTRHEEFPEGEKKTW
ncbi:MAG: DinB family protein [Bacteroidota bacterium]